MRFSVMKLLVSDVSAASLRRFVLLSPLLVALSGCGGDPAKRDVGKVIVVRGANQCVLPKAACAKKLVVELLSPRQKGIFGGKGYRHPVPGAKVRFECHPDSDLSFDPAEATSDSGGVVRTIVKAGETIGDQYFDVIPVDFPDKRQALRVICGVKIDGANQEELAGRTLDDPIRLTLVSADGTSIEGAKVYFHLSGTPAKRKVKASVEPESTRTNAAGQAECRMKMGETTGVYTVTAEVQSPEKNVHIRGLEINEMGLNLWTLIPTVLGGLAIFIYGMRMMSDGLQLVAGEGLKAILQHFVSNRLMAVLAGAVVTGVIQSSSACTVMVVGFVNAGLLTLRQAIGIIFGANIGTTMTAQMISFKLGGLAFPAIVVGLIMLLIAKRTAIRGWGQTIFGFGMLFFGMGLMGNELKLIGTFPSFVDFFAHFDCSPVNGHMPLGAVLGTIMIGTLMTVVIQSSSATIGIAFALAMGGLINFYTAVPLILGDNIGTTITAILASIGANKPAKQTALAHFLFNFLGTSYMFILFFINVPGTDTPVYLWFINVITPGDVFGGVPENITRHIAMAHTMFNVFNVAMFLPFVNGIARLCNWIIKIDERESIKLTMLEPHLLNTPAVAIEQAIIAIRQMTEDSWNMVKAAMNNAFIIAQTDEKLEVSLMEEEDRIDELQINLTDYLAKITQNQLTEPQAEIIPLLMHCTNDAERIADHTENILKLAGRIEKAKKPLTRENQEALMDLWRVLSDQAEHVLSCLMNTDQKEMISALEDERKINTLTAKLEKNHIKRLRKKKSDVVSGIIFIEILAELEKVGDHLTNIAERAPELQVHHLNLKNLQMEPVPKPPIDVPSPKKKDESTAEDNKKEKKE